VRERRNLFDLCLLATGQITIAGCEGNENNLSDVEGPKGAFNKLFLGITTRDSGGHADSQ